MGGGGKDQVTTYEPGADCRMDFVFDYCTRALKIKMDKWQKMLLVEEYRNAIIDFFDKEESMVRA